MQSYTIEQIERAINILRARNPADPKSQSLCAEARILATPYTLMFMSGRGSITADELSERERHALSGALG
jgi:hypothetical protein